MMIAAKITLTNADTGYSVFERLQTLWTSLGRDPRNLFPRCASVTICYLESDTAWVVPETGVYAETGGVPDQFGYTFDAGPLWDKAKSFNDIGLDEIVLGSHTAGAEFSILAYTV